MKRETGTVPNIICVEVTLCMGYRRAELQTGPQLPYELVRTSWNMTSSMCCRPLTMTLRSIYPRQRTPVSCVQSRGYQWTVPVSETLTKENADAVLCGGAFLPFPLLHHRSLRCSRIGSLSCRPQKDFVTWTCLQQRAEDGKFEEPPSGTVKSIAAYHKP